MPFRSLQCGTLFLTFVHPVFSLLSWTSTILPLPSVPCQLRRSLRWIPDILHLHLRVLEPSQAQTPIFTARHGGWQFPKGNLELVLMLYRKRHHLGDYIHHFWAKKPDRTFLEFPPRSSRNSSHLSLLSSHSEQAHLKKPPPSPLAKVMVSCDDETLSSRSYWCRSQPSSKVTQGLFGVTYVWSSWWDHQGATEHFGRENGRKQHAWIFISFNEFLMWFLEVFYWSLWVIKDEVHQRLYNCVKHLEFTSSGSSGIHLI